RTGLPCLEQAKIRFQEKKLSSVIAAAELYMQKQNERSRVYDVIAALSDERTIDKLGLAFFDILEINGQSLKSAPYETVFQHLNDIFPKTGQAHVIETHVAKSKSVIPKFFAEWVQEQGEEGIIVRCDMPYMYKIKPKHTFDVIIVGYVEGVNEHKGKVKTLLFALMRESGTYQVIGRVGNNLSEDDRQKYYDILSQNHVDSTYIESDNDGVAFHMVQPEIVIEVGCNDILLENTYGNPMLNNVLQYDQHRYSLYNTVPGVRFIHPMVERMRDDKTNVFEDIRFSQVSDLIYIEEEAMPTPDALPKSEVLFREVYKKTAKEKTMVQKFVVWKTNKEKLDPRYPAYVMYYTNFSSNRKDPLQTEVRISQDHSQMMQIVKEFIETNVKKGWELV
ncbi:MAG: ATP-dependent DNA ligase, partial [Desulfobacterales bacterium]|nr:ATP-dependent DNA ligase [Desulfobacterales bacterium]